MKKLFFFMLMVVFMVCSTVYSQVVLDTGDIAHGLFFDSGLYNNFGDEYSSPHIFLLLKYGFSRSTALYCYIDYGEYFKHPYDKNGIAVGAGAKLALIKEGELDIPLAANFGIKGDADIISDMDLYNIVANVTASYNILEEMSLKPYISLGIRYTDYKVYTEHFNDMDSDDYRGFAVLGTEYRINDLYSIFGEISVSDDITAGASFRMNL